MCLKIIKNHQKSPKNGYNDPYTYSSDFFFYFSHREKNTENVWSSAP